MWEFTAELWPWREDEPGSWVFVTLPPDIGEELAIAAGPRNGFGSVKVVATIGESTWSTSVFPEGGGGSFVLPVKKAVRKAEALDVGDAPRVRVALASS
jgi:hypothetical protein